MTGESSHAPSPQSDVHAPVAIPRASAAPVAEPFWFGPATRPLLGWLHLPATRQIRGAVLLCQPLGIEATCIYYTYGLLADQLAGLGLAVLRFDYDGTGDSAGSESDPDRVSAWLGSLAQATDLLHSLGAEKIGMVGIRMGALLCAQEAARRADLHALVLWDPCLSGRSFLREQQLLHRLGDLNPGSSAAPGALDIPGIRFSPETVADLKTLDLTEGTGTLADEVLVLLPPGRTRPPALERRLASHATTWQEAVGQEHLLDSALQEPPQATITAVASWLAHTLTSSSCSVGDEWSAHPAKGTLGTVATLPHEDGAIAVTEEVQLFGPLPLFGIVSTSSAPDALGTVILVNEGNTHHIGQARLWVELARHLATVGYRVLRFDLSGNGDSGLRVGQLGHVARAPEAVDDIQQAMAAMSPEAPNEVLLVGFCSGGYEVMEVALESPPRAICIVNPSPTFLQPEPAGSFSRPARQLTKEWVARAAQLPLTWVGRHRSSEEVARWQIALATGSWPAAVATRRPNIPPWAWTMANRFLLDHPSIETLERIVGAGVDTVLICGEDDYLPVSLGAEHRMAELETSPHFSRVMVDSLDHASWTQEQRAILIDVLTLHIVRTFGIVTDGGRRR